jgi:Fanconi anemia group M protein
MIRIKDFTPRLYQETILSTCIQRNTLVVLPTGMGKTAISFLLTIHRLRQYPNSRILILSPTRPLCQQHVDSFKKHLEIDENKIVLFTGFIKPEKRKELWNNATIIVSTPQSIENDIISGRIPLEDVSLTVFDEAHRAIGDYAYVFVAKQYYKKARFPRILGLTASPGSDLEKIQDVCKNLYIEDIEVRTEDDPDVKPYIQEVKIQWIKVDLPKIYVEIQKYLKDFLKERMEKLKRWGILQRANLAVVNKKDLLMLQAQLRGRVASGEKDFVLWNAISLMAEIMKIQHALELLETQGVNSLFLYFEKLQNEARTTNVKAVKNLVKDLNFRSALIKTIHLYESGFQHPKLIELLKLVEREIKNNPDIKIIVFNQYRDNAFEIVEDLNKINGIKAQLFVGQAIKGQTGLSQKKQKEILDKFKEGEFNILVATSVGEEGLDIMKVDLVIFYEPIPSAIRHIQRRGRTGRSEKGRVIILMAKNTRDEGYRWSAHHKEKRMYKHLENLRKKITLSTLTNRQEIPLTKFQENKIKIFADYREKGSGIIKELIEQGVNINLEKLENADYILSSRVGVEIKTVEDFVDSIIDKRLLIQIKEMKSKFERPLIIIEGNKDIFSVRNVHPNAIRGMLATIAISYGIPVLQTKNSKETAILLAIIAKREQEDNNNLFSLHGEKRTRSLKDQQEYVVSALPGVGMSLAKPLLREFKTIKKIVNAKQEQLEKVEKIGVIKAKQIKDVVEKEYEV